VKRTPVVSSSFEAAEGASQRRRILFTITLALLLAASGMAIYKGRQVSLARAQLQALQEEQSRFAERIRQLEQERDKAVKQLAALFAHRGPELPRPPMSMQVTPQPGASPGEDLQCTNLYARFKDQMPKLTSEQVEAYLKANGRKASSLLAGYRTSGDGTLLKEAMGSYPTDPQVAFEAIFSKDLSPAEKRQWLNAFEQNAPDNPLANYLSARDYLNAGQTDLAVQELAAAAGKQQFQDYTLSRRQDDEEAYLAAGYSTAEAKMIASDHVELPQLSELKQLGLQMVDLSRTYRQAGDENSSQAMLQMAVGLGQSYSAGDCAISHLVGLAVERIALSAMDPNSPYGDSGLTVQQQLDQLTQQKTAISVLFKDNESLLQSMSDQDWISYIDRDKMFGEEAALRWAVGKLGKK
jgi:hypothetical protein